MTSRRALLAGAAMAGSAAIAALIATAAPTMATASGSNTVFVAGGGIGGTGSGLSDLESLVVIGGSSTGTGPG